MSESVPCQWNHAWTPESSERERKQHNVALRADVRAMTRAQESSPFSKAHVSAGCRRQLKTHTRAHTAETIVFAHVQQANLQRSVN